MTARGVLLVLGVDRNPERCQGCAIMEPTSRYDLVDKATDGNLKAILDDGPTYAAARDKLRDRYGIAIPEATLRRWHQLAEQAS